MTTTQKKRGDLLVGIERNTSTREVHITLTAESRALAEELFQSVCAGVRKGSIVIELGEVLDITGGHGVVQ